jgi:transmembrane sensor
MTQPHINRTILAEAADWMMQLHAGNVTAEQRLAWERWRQTSGEHAQAWQRAEVLMHKFGSVPSALGMPALHASQRSRRKAVSRLAMLMAALPMGWLSWHLIPDTLTDKWFANYATDTGQQRTIQLADGTQLQLNTATAVNITFNEHQRVVHLLHGEIAIQTAKDDRHRPFHVQTKQGLLEALGTRFNVRVDGDTTSLTVTEHAVRVTPHKQPAARTIVHAGQHLSFTASASTSVTHADNSMTAWQKGMLLIDNQPLSAVIHELERYRSGILHYTPEIGNIRISGTFPIDNIDLTLSMLSNTYPIAMTQRFNGYWITLTARK